MTLARAWSVALVGLEGTPVEVEAHIGTGLPRTVLVGLPDASLYEARDRCRAAMASTGFGWPADPVTINLSPATLPKAGSHYDLSIVAAIGAARGACDVAALEGLVLLGELGLDGRVRPVRGLLPAVLAASQHQFRAVVVPAGQQREAALVEGLTVWGVQDLADLFDVLRGGPGTVMVPEPDERPDPSPPPGDLRDVAGQAEGRWALEVAAAGRHHLYLHGPPGVGKTLLAERLPGILPDLERSESLEVSAIHSLAGVSLPGGLIRRPPYSDPHHSASVASLVGGGARIAVPGSVSRAHRGVLFLDEAPEFSPRALEALRVPLESGRIVLGRALATAVYPASFQLVLAANPCPCGMAATPGAVCRCPPMAIRRYADRVSGPILDRIDIHQHLRPVRKAFLAQAVRSAESSAAVAVRVQEARQRQAVRLGTTGWRTNGEVPGPVLRRQLPLPDGIDLLDEAVSRGRLSARGVDKVLRLAWTIADLAGRDRPGREQLHVALAMRRGEEPGAVGRKGA
ncbi:MAG TPA: YifB family Mg chelatase-like AAA ATPase [Propionicimonas sp.]|jgi:magnesium chelatase family protein|nr:YifB family Mg chelatase-like AAA ATPase [Propionicimonas sp.]